MNEDVRNSQIVVLLGYDWANITTVKMPSTKTMNKNHYYYKNILVERVF